jgi:hypothetical protein
MLTKKTLAKTGTVTQYRRLDTDVHRMVAHLLQAPDERRNPQNKTASSGQFAGKNLIDITPDPGLASFIRAHYGMLRFVKVLGGMFVLGRVATPDVAAHQAHP